jgi:hypothetical protein
MINTVMMVKNLSPCCIYASSSSPDSQCLTDVARPLAWRRDLIRAGIETVAVRIAVAVNMEKIGKQEFFAGVGNGTKCGYALHLTGRPASAG